MVCIHCGSETKVTNSRPQKRSNQVWRRRECLICHATFTTEESAKYNAEWLVKTKAGSIQPFSRDKLFLSLLKSLEHRKNPQKDATALTDTIISKLSTAIKDSTINSHSIVQITLVALNRFDDAASVSYAAYHA